MPKSEIEALPEELRKLFLAYIAPLYDAISDLLHSRNDDEFEHNFDKVTSKFLLYSIQTELTLDEDHVNQLAKTYLEYSSHAATAQTPLAQALNDANEIIANFIRLMIEPNYRDYVPKHHDVFIPYIRLLVYATILIYILNESSETDIQPSVVKKIIRKCQETTWNVEGYVDTIEIDADPEASAALERIKQTSF